MKDSLFQQLAKQLCDTLPLHLKEAKKDIEKNFHLLLKNAFNKLEIVTREEFDIQTKVLARSRKKIDLLEAQIKALEQKIENE
ncbi:MAG: accessory factor UbiK family protein [Gammaproteobacteria bacterium]|nr:accessory factor UbiK family protein [Gammaproteobacteria bacterium]